MYLSQEYLENVQKLIRKAKGIIEENMRKIEFVDSLVRKVFNVRLYVLMVYCHARIVQSRVGSRSIRANDQYREPFVGLKPVIHSANLFARTDKKVGTLPTCSRRIFSPANFNQSRCQILAFASREQIRPVENGLKL